MSWLVHCLTKLILALSLIGALSVAHAGQQCAISDGNTYVALPKDGPMPASSPIQIKKGMRYEVGPLMAGWIGVQVNGDFVWARATIFAYSCHPTVGGKTYASRNPQPFKSPTTNINVSPPPSAGGCPCGSGRVCVGPRGGRYCITSGGNKRYGQ